MPTPSPQQLRLAELAVRNALAEEGGGLARERIDLLLDEGTFEESGKLVTHRAADFAAVSGLPEWPRVPGDGVVTGHGRIDGRPVCVFAQDPGVFGGTLSEANSARIAATIEQAVRIGAPVIGLYDSDGPRVPEGVVALAGQTEILRATSLASGVVPQISVILGHCLGLAAVVPALTDFVIRVHEAQTDAHFFGNNEREAFGTVRKLLGFLEKSHRGHSPTAVDEAGLDAFLPDSCDEPYDVLQILHRIIDDGDLLQVHEHFAENMVVGLARMAGRAVGIVANQPAVLGGALDGDACLKAADFVRLCDQFRLPILTFVDCQGFLEEAPAGQAARLVSAFARVSVPRLTVVTRKAWGAGYSIMAPKQLGTGLTLAWPSAEILILDPAAAVDTLYRREFDDALRTAQAVWPQGKAFSEQEKLALLAELRQEKLDEYRERFANPYLAAERGYLDAVIRPSETRRRLVAALGTGAETDC